MLLPTGRFVDPGARVAGSVGVRLWLTPTYGPLRGYHFQTSATWKTGPCRRAAS